MIDDGNFREDVLDDEISSAVDCSVNEVVCRGVGLKKHLSLRFLVGNIKRSVY